jgi:hypothetical protein
MLAQKYIPMNSYEEWNSRYEKALASMTEKRQ